VLVIVTIAPEKIVSFSGEKSLVNYNFHFGFGLSLLPQIISSLLGTRSALMDCSAGLGNDGIK